MPEYITKAFMAFYEYGTEEEPIEEFASRWGGLDLDIFTHVLEVGQGEDKLIALFALGYSGQPEARGRLLPFLQSQVRIERWASALCLGEVKAEQALPVLENMLQEGLFDEEVPDISTGDDAMWYEEHRVRVAYLLGEWGNPGVVPFLRQALQASWQREQQVTAPSYLHFYYGCQDALAYALGKLGAFGALLHLELPQSRLYIALIYIVLGHLYTSKGYGYFDVPWQLLTSQGLRADMLQVLEQRFGLSVTEGEEMVKSFLDEYNARKRSKRSRAREG
jgi:hypothetical protein